MYGNDEHVFVDLAATDARNVRTINASCAQYYVQMLNRSTHVFSSKDATILSNITYIKSRLCPQHPMFPVYYSRV